MTSRFSDPEDYEGKCVSVGGLASETGQPVHLGKCIVDISSDPEVASTIQRLRDALKTALRQWAAHYAEQNSEDIDKGTGSESASYRWCHAIAERCPREEEGE